MDTCDHVYLLKETKKQRGERAMWGVHSTKPWIRIDLYFCQKCLKEMVKKQEAEYIENRDPPDWW